MLRETMRKRMLTGDLQQNAKDLNCLSDDKQY